jgi:aminotransferase
MLRLSERAKPLQQSGIRASTVRCAEVGGINLGQGVCDMPMDEVIKHSAYKAIENNKSLYSACEGLLPLRQALAEKLRQFNRIDACPKQQIIVTHGSTGAFVCATQALFNPGDEVIMFAPFYGYHHSILSLHGVKVRVVNMALPSFAIELSAVAAAINAKTRAIVICTPCNPCGKVFSHAELLALGRLATEHNLAIITDEIYEYITYPGFEHVSIASLEDFSQRTLTISGFSKTYNMTGWRLGYVCGPSHVIERMALLQDLLYVCPVTPLQYAMLDALSLPESYYADMRAYYLCQRDKMYAALSALGFAPVLPQGAYYMMADIRGLGFADDQALIDAMLEQAKVAAVPGRAFFQTAQEGSGWLRFGYALADEKIDQGLAQLKALVRSA